MDTNQILLAVAGFVGVTVILSFVSHMQKKSSWTGVVCDKDHVEADEDGAEQFFIYVKTDSGKKVKVPVDSKMFGEFNLGDKVEKKSGDYFPQKI